MRFCSPKVIKYFANPVDNLVSTMRTYPYRINQRILLRDCNGRIMGYGVIVDAAAPTTDILEKWLKYSGFSSVNEWIREALRLHRRKPRYVYLVKILEIKCSEDDEDIHEKPLTKR